MQLSNMPGKLVLPFANAGDKSTIPVASQIGITAGAASLADGFPPLTRTPVASGGVPPSGLDMNGILYEMSAIIRWANAGGGYPYDSVFATDTNVGGYPMGARIMRSDGTGYWFNTAENNVTDPESAGAASAGWVPDFTAGVAAVAMVNSDVTLTPVQYGKPAIVITGTLTANRNLIFPNIAGKWVIINNAIGNYSITAKTSAGSGVTITPSFKGQVFGDGANITHKFQDLSESDGALNVGFKQFGANAIARFVEEKLREIVSVKDFGAVGDGRDDRQAIQYALDAAAAAGGKALYFPAGIYMISSPLYMPKMASLPGARPATIRLFGESNQVSVIYNRSTSEAAFIYPTDAAGIDSINIDDLQILADNGGGGIKIQSDVGGLYLNRFFMNGCSAGQWAINHTTGIVYTAEIVGRFWNAYGYNGGVASINGGINITFRDCFISQQQKNGPIIAISNTKNITIDTIQIEGANSATTAQVGIQLAGYCFNFNVRNLYLEGHIDTGVSFGTTNLTSGKIDGIYAFYYAGNISPVMIDASGAPSHRNIKATNLVYNNIDTTSGSGYIFNDPNHRCELDEYFYNNSDGNQATRLWKQHIDYSQKRGMNDVGFVGAGGAISTTIALPANKGMYELDFAILNSDGNHQAVSRYWLVWDSGFSNNFSNTQQLGSSICKGAAPSSIACSVNTSGVVTISAKATLAGDFHVKWSWRQLVDVIY